MDALFALWAGLGAGAGWLGGAQAPPMVKQAEAPKMLSAAEAQSAAHEIGTVIWASHTDEDVTSVIDGDLDNPELIRSAIRVGEALFHRKIDGIGHFDAFVSALRMKAGPYGDRVAKSLHEGLRIIDALNKIMSRGRTAEERATDAEQAAAMHLTDYDAPAEMYEAMLEAERSFVCLSALVDMATGAYAPPRRWLFEHVLRTWVEGNRRFLHLAVAFHGGAGVPADLLRKEYAIDRHDMLKKHNDEEATFERFMRDRS